MQQENNTSTLNQQKWSGKTNCNSFWMRATFFWIRCFGLRGFYCLMATFIPFYMIGCPKATGVSYRYFRERHVYSPLKAFASVYMNMFRFGQVITDRFAAVDGFRFRFEATGNDEYWLPLEREAPGFMQLGSHAGNYELCGYMLCPEHKQVTTLVYLGEGENVMNNRYRMFTPNNIHMTAVKPDMSHIFELNTFLSDGGIVSMPGDRNVGSAKTITVQLLGADADLPQGPFALAVARSCPLTAVFCMKKSWDTYDLRVFRLDDASVADLPRNKRQQQLADNYAKALDSVLRDYPTQWFNFYEFWKK